MRYLLERLESGGENVLPLEAAIGLQISRLVAVHEWELPSGMGEQLGMGLPSAVDIGDGRDMKRYAERLLAVIRSHEPRLEKPKVRVENAGNHATPRIVIEAFLQSETGPRPFLFTLPGE